MNALFPEEEIELKILVYNESDRKIINDIIIKFPITWDIIREMIMKGWNVNQIQTFCNEIYFKGKIISDIWNSIKWIDTVGSK